MKAPKVLLTILHVLVLSVLVTSCATPAVAPTAAPATQSVASQAPATVSTASQAPAASTNPVTIVVSSGGFGDNMQVGIDLYRKQFPDRVVNLVVIPHDSLEAKMVTELSTHSGSVDCVPVEAPAWLQTLNPFLLPLQPYIDKTTGFNLGDLLPLNISPDKYPYPDGQILAIPVRQGVDILHYRKDVFDAAGLQPPVTFDDVVTIGMKLKKPGFFPLSMHLKQGVYLVQAFLQVLYGMGGSVLNKDLTKAELGPTAVATTQWLVDAIYKYQIISPTDLNSQVEDVYTKIQKGDADFAFLSSANIVPLNPDVVAKGGTLAYAALPHSTAVLGNGGEYWSFSFGINKDSPNKDACWELINFLAATPAQVQMAIQTGNGPARASVFADANYQKSSAAAAATLNGMKYGRPVDPHPKWNQIQDILASEVSLALTQKVTAQQAMDDATKQINTLIGTP
jgi:multiple sugar transport system substrate-binding protein